MRGQCDLVAWMYLFPLDCLHCCKHLSVRLPLIWILVLMLPQCSSVISIIKAAAFVNGAVRFAITTLLLEVMWNISKCSVSSIL
jgi:hypothetical protein